MAIRPNQPLSIGGVLDLTFQLYRACLVRVLPLCVLMVVATSAQSIYMLTHIAAGGGSAVDPFGMAQMMTSPGYWIAYLITVIGAVWITAALYLKVSAIGEDEDISVGAALQKALGRMPWLVVTTILMVIAIMIGCVLLLVPGLILMVSLMLSFALVIFEDKGPIDALTGSHRLVWGNWWRTAAILVVGFIILMVIYFLAGVLFALVLPFIGFASEGAIMLSMATSIAVGALMSLLITPFYIALLLAVYWDLKLRKEGGDLAARVGALKTA